MADEPRKPKKVDYGKATNAPEDASSEKEEKPEKVVEAVVETTVIVKKKGIGSKIRGIISQADLPGVINYVTYDVLIPAARNMIVDGLIEGVHRAFYKGERYGRGHSMYGGGSNGPRFSYSTPVDRSSSPLSRSAPPRSAVLGSRTSRHIRDDFIISTRSDADRVLERLNDIIDRYGVASVGELKDLMGVPSSHVDEKWGWLFLGDASVTQVREGFILDLPPEEPLQ